MNKGLEKIAIKFCEKAPLIQPFYEKEGYCTKPNDFCEYCNKVNGNESLCNKKTYTPLGEINLA